ncbi:MAG TPA: hypothetical protein PK513_03350 [Alphaproteobacteria bacterium]|nr:hypothetical protein [Alphaproteobacteria bacterium]USO05116.1 MAG: hypothetical protein H6859_08135 [Rhodospirillales bacterium]HOO81520.1 hypothetical protein [Alphaproteobacteria bacterium]
MSKLVKSKRVVTFVPADHTNEFAKSMAAYIPHLFGCYDSVCWWGTPKTEKGMEQYRPLDREIEQTPSVRMEFSIPDDPAALENFTAALKKHHPWQEPVILIFDSQIIDG